jgi:hypothetical protein
MPGRRRQHIHRGSERTKFGSLMCTMSLSLERQNMIGGMVMNRIRFIVASVVMVIVLSLVVMPTVFGQGSALVEDFEGIDSAAQLDEDTDASSKYPIPP